MSAETKTQEETSEQLYDITKQPEPCCPLIDTALTDIEKLQRRIRGYELSDESELRDMLSDVEYALGNLSGYGRSGYLEDIRARVEAVRAWGQEWKDYAKKNSEPPTPFNQ